MSRPTGRRFIKNAVILTLTTFLLRALGMWMRIYLSGRIGAAGMGLYHLIFTLYTLFITLGTSGLQVAVTRIATLELGLNGGGRTRSSMRRLLFASAALGFFAAAMLYLCAPFAAERFLKDSRCIGPLRLLSLSLPFMAVSASLRGYFMARRKVEPNSTSQLFEQLVRIGLIALLLGRTTSPAEALVLVAVSNTVSELASTLLMLLIYRRDTMQLPQSAGHPTGVLKNLLVLAGPVAGGRYLTSALHTAENVMVPGRLALHTGSQEGALAQFGCLKGMAMPLLLFPSSVLAALSALLVPEVTSLSQEPDQRRLQAVVTRSLQITFDFSFLVAGLFLLLARPLGVLIYKSTEVGFLLAVLAPITPFIYLENIADGILKGLGQQVAGFWYNCIDSVVRILLILALVPRLGMAGFLFVMLVSNILTGTLNVNRLIVVSRVPFLWYKWIAAPACSLAGAAFITAAVSKLPFFTGIPLLLRLILLGALCSVCYLIGLVAFGGAARGDLHPGALPGAEIEGQHHGHHRHHLLRRKAAPQRQHGKNSDHHQSD